MPMKVRCWLPVAADWFGQEVDGKQEKLTYDKDKDVYVHKPSGKNFIKVLGKKTISLGEEKQLYEYETQSDDDDFVAP